MSELELNKDGLVPGASVSFEAIVKANKMRRAAKPITPEAIDGMSKDDVSELLEAHGVDGKGKVSDMRATLKQVMFLGGSDAL